MKKYIIFPIVLSLGILCSCEHAEFLNQKPISQTSPENFYNNESEMKMGLISCYEVINTHKIPGASYVQRGTYGQGLIYIMNAPSDDIVAATSSSDEGLEMEWGNYVESTRCVRDFWKTFFVGINRCNTVLAYLDKAGLSDSTKIQYESEARFLRAFFYYHLAWNFGGVPIVTSNNSDGQEPRSSLEDVYAFILEDLRYAYAHLNTTGILNTSSANKYTAAAYIGRICNYLAACKRNNVGADLVSEQPLNDFSWVDADAMTKEALDALAFVVNNSPYVLIDDYTNLFRETTKEDQYKECLFLAELPLSGAEGYWPLSFYLPSPVSNGSLTPTVYGGRHVPTPRAFYMYHPQDIRRDHNFTGRLNEGYVKETVGQYNYYKPNPPKTTVKVTYEVVDEDGNTVYDPETGEPETYTVEENHPLYDNLETQTYLPISGIQTCPGKVRLAEYSQLQHTYQQHAFSYPLMRYADVLLMYAEALYFSGNESEARVQMDKVLRRASTSEENFQTLKEYYYRSDFLEELLESRERELIFEFSRKWDLIRFNKIDEAISSLNTEKVVEMEGKVDDKYLSLGTGGSLQLGLKSLTQNWQHHKIWLPISEEQIGVNHNLTQNAGW